jgi:hypothetical protein
MGAAAAQAPLLAAILCVVSLACWPLLRGAARPKAW